MSDGEEPPTKRRRLSLSSLSDADEEDEDEEDKPLAAQVSQPQPPDTLARKSNQRTGKKTSSMKSKSQTAPTSTMQPDVNGVNGRLPDAKVKVEEKMDESQLTRLATGVTIDAGPSSTTHPPSKTEKAAFVELRKGIIQVTAVENDGTPRSLVILTGLKTLFRTQLPMMPREYIARLVYDKNSKALAIIKRGYKVVGGICYRPFPHRGFAEIVFFATASVDQVKGYGGMLMDHFKAHVRKTYPNVMHFLTYADNFAVIFFKKQGFSKDITLHRSVWAGYIKDYEGGTIMQCTMLRKVDYLDKTNIIARQREAIIAKIREKSRSHIVYKGLDKFQEGQPEGVVVDPKEVPGLRESGWTTGMSTHSRSTPQSAEHNFMHRLLGDMKAHPNAWPFSVPVNGEEVADYYEVIKRPMDLSTMEHKLNTNQYPHLKTFLDDAQLIFDNCRFYNPEGSIYVKHAAKLEKVMKELVADYEKRVA
ncbi:Bromodomain-containing protein [Boletus coccyginus]|nr:Bromodomain-containing protein [Boletus coccyginus]